MNIQEMITRTVELELLELKRANGAVIKYKESGKWNEEDPSVRLVSELQYRIQQPPQPEGYEWCGYDVPRHTNCDAYFDARMEMILLLDNHHVEMDINNGYRHLYRRVVPETIPYTPETYDLVKDAKFRRVRYIDGKKNKDELFFVGSVMERNVMIGSSCYDWELAYKRYEWPDGSPFGTEVTE